MATAKDRMLYRLVITLAAFSFFASAITAQERSNVSQRTKDALLHVLAHEMGHAMLREFDLPVLGPEEDIADDFATIYIHLTLPDRAADIIAARAAQNMADGTQPEMFSEYRNDDQRAGRSVCLLYGQDPDGYADLAAQFDLEGDDANNCRDFSTEVGRSWRRIIANYRMPQDIPVTEVGLVVADNPTAQALASEDFLEDAYALMSGIDWHSRITVAFDQCDGGASWSRNRRRITICDAYIARFESQLAE